ncbi:hypothetical protein NDU88_007487 [Pleurodeles waltl]|uniref:Uncharacterized protein n=1 Tax=Pleurodeles waltl TaxID=8319 RepID=A0AAV7SSZ5_PLEWA|nr:hypothetical protein NDU88_007487 [Pleurodeles waltl]
MTWLDCSSAGALLPRIPVLHVLQVQCRPGWAAADSARPDHPQYDAEPANGSQGRSNIPGLESLYWPCLHVSHHLHGDLETRKLTLSKPDTVAELWQSVSKMVRSLVLLVSALFSELPFSLSAPVEYVT